MCPTAGPSHCALPRSLRTCRCPQPGGSAPWAGNLGGKQWEVSWWAWLELPGPQACVPGHWDPVTRPSVGPSRAQVSGGLGTTWECLPFCLSLLLASSLAFSPSSSVPGTSGQLQQLGHFQQKGQHGGSAHRQLPAAVVPHPGVSKRSEK